MNLRLGQGRLELALFLMFCQLTVNSGNLDGPAPNEMASTNPIPISEFVPIDYCEQFSDISQWVAMPQWLANPSSSAALEKNGAGVTFQVKEPGKGMKWHHKFDPPISADYSRILIKYRAYGVNAVQDYFISLHDLAGGEHTVLTLDKLICDGKSRQLSATLSGISDISLQMQATDKGDSKVVIEEMRFTTEENEAAVSELSIDLKRLKWDAKTDWLYNATEKYKASINEEFSSFLIGQAAQGMKWACDFGKKIDVNRYNTLKLRYKAKNVADREGYTLCLMEGMDGASNSVAVVTPGDLNRDGNIHTLTVPLDDAVRKLPVAIGLALQVQAVDDKDAASLQIYEATFQSAQNANSLEAALSLAASEWKDGYVAVKMESLYNCDASPILNRLHYCKWFENDVVAWNGIPFSVSKEPKLLSSTFKGRERLRIPFSGKAGGAYVLLFGIFRGMDEPLYNSLTVMPLRIMRDVDRFRMRVAYDDGTVDECMPYNCTYSDYAIHSGPQIVYVACDGKRKVSELVLCDDSSQAAAFAVSSVTFADTEKAEVEKPLNLLWTRSGKKWGADTRKGIPRITVKDGVMELANHHYSMRFAIDASPRLLELNGKRLTDAFLIDGLRLDGVDVNPGEWELHSQPTMNDAGGRPSASLIYHLKFIPDIHVEIQLSIDDSNETVIKGRLINAGNSAILANMSLPAIGPFILGGKVRDMIYAYPCDSGVLGNCNYSYRSRYGGKFPLQFMSVSDPVENTGIYLRTEDGIGDTQRYYTLNKNASRGITMKVDYESLKLPPGGAVDLIPARLGITAGDWHDALEAYRGWLKTWYSPASPRQQWFQEVFNFRQRFVFDSYFDALYDERSGTFNLQDALAKDKEAFGGVDYLHLFDWGERTYGRAGDCPAYARIKGGRGALREAIRSVQISGIPVGLYIEGYLLHSEKSRLASKFKDWRLADKNGNTPFYPGSVENYICPSSKEWRDVQTETYATKVRELDVDGMYIDQFGAAIDDGPNIRECWDARHGHAVPSNPVVEERKMLQAVRKGISGVKQNVLFLSEYTPCDVNSQWQDGAFSYQMYITMRRGTYMTIPINFSRFALPGFKTVEALDAVLGSSATSVKWTFFNGEGFWIWNTTERYESQTKDAIRKCHSVFREHRKAFASKSVTPLVDTLREGVYANRFAGDDETVYTLYNAHPKTVRGPLLFIADGNDLQCFDAWNRRTLAKHPVEGGVEVELEVGPYDIGCIVVKQQVDRPYANHTSN
ncbi:MAG: DUF6259 domain-containing protein [Lentisphaeria bacterium]